MKKIFNLFAGAILLVGIASCQKVETEDISTSPVAPELFAHNDILMTSNTMDEDVNFSWKEYRNLPEGLQYTLYATYGGATVALAQTYDTRYKTDKTTFQALLYNAFSNLPENNTFSMTFYVSVTSDGVVYESNEVTINIYANGDAIAPVITTLYDELVLDPSTPTEEITIIEWTAARLVYGEEISYNVYVAVNVEGSTEIVKYQIAEGISGNSLTITIDELNEAIVAAGGAEAEASEVTFYVEAVCSSQSITTESDSITITTYVSTFPDTMYLPGSYQGWDPAKASTLSQSTVSKGLYEGFVNLTTEDGSDCQFKFSPNPEWKDDFGGVVTVDQSAGGYNYATGSVGVSDNIVVPSGFYFISLNKKLNTVTLIQVNTLSMIGSSVGDFGWGSDVDMVYDAETQTFVVESTEMKEGEFKLRFNHDWTYSMGGTVDAVSYTTGDNIAFSKDAATYKVVLDVSSCPFTFKFINTDYPENIYIPGGHNGWSFSTMIAGDGEGHYEGFATLGSEFKFTPEASWDNDWGGTNTDGTITLVEKDKNITCDGGYYKIYVDLTELTSTITKIETVGIIGAFADNNWASDFVSLTYDSNSDSWKASSIEIPKNTQWKFRMNEAWAINLGGELADLTQDGGNIVESDGGIYDVELFLSTTPYRAVLTKVGNLDFEYAENITIAGDYSGNNWSADEDAKLFSTGSGVYQGAITMYNATYGFKVVHQGAWMGSSAQDGLEYTLDSSGDNMTIDNGTYWWTVDLAKNKATAIAIEAVSLSGSFNNWGDTEMTFDSDNLVYTLTQDLSAGDKIKVKFNNGWDYNLGGDTSALTMGGGDIAVTDAGTYTITLNLCKTATLTLSK